MGLFANTPPIGVLCYSRKIDLPRVMDTGREPFCSIQSGSKPTICRGAAVQPHAFDIGATRPL